MRDRGVQAGRCGGIPVDENKIDVLHTTRRGGRLRVTGRLLKAISRASAYGGLLVWFLIYRAKQDSMGFVASIAWVIAGVMAIIALLAVYLLGWFLDRRGERYQALAAADAMNQDLHLLSCISARFSMSRAPAASGLASAVRWSTTTASARRSTFAPRS